MAQKLGPAQSIRLMDNGAVSDDLNHITFQNHHQG